MLAMRPQRSLSASAAGSAEPDALAWDRPPSPFPSIREYRDLERQLDSHAARPHDPEIDTIALLNEDLPAHDEDEMPPPYDPSASTRAVDEKRPLSPENELERSDSYTEYPPAPESELVVAAREGALRTAQDSKGWAKDVALAQLEWLGADADRRARWVYGELSARRRRASKGKLGFSGKGKGRADEGSDGLCAAGTARCAAEDLATRRRLAAEAHAGEARTRAEAAAREKLETAVAMAKSARATAGAQDGDAERAARQASRAADGEFHAAYAAAKAAHEAALAHAQKTHFKAWSAAQITYLGARLREPDAAGEGRAVAPQATRRASVSSLFDCRYRNVGTGWAR